MNIRPAVATDVSTIQGVARRAWREAYVDIIPPETIDETVDEWYSPETLQRALDSPGTAFLVATVDGDVIGFSHGVVVGDEGDILRMYVDPAYQRHGVGTALHERLRRDLDDFNMRRMRAMLLADNHQGAAFYRKLGFEKTGEDAVEIGGRRYVEHVYTLPLREEAELEDRSRSRAES
ncbi:N-acetyltransferase family protein [Haloferacaceae archaeon DSL9]